jgi:hypothetical protein
LDMTVFALANISQLVLSYVEWLERRRGSKRQAPAAKGQAPSFHPVAPSTLANYLNSLVAIVKFQLRYQLERRDPLLDQLRNLRSQAESYSATQKKFARAHPEWCSWQDLQLAREKCRAAFDEMDDAGHRDSRAYLLLLRELCLLCLYTICPPPRCSVIRLLEWDKTLVVVPGGAGLAAQWSLDLTDVAHAATRHKTHKHKGAMQLPLPKMLSPYLVKLRAASPAGVSAVFPPGLLSAPATLSSDRSDSPDGVKGFSGELMDSNSFAYWVKRTFCRYTEGGQAPNPSLLRSIYTTWLYSLRYDSEDPFLKQVKASSAKWKAHSERVAGVVYNKEMMYQKKEFALLLRFSEEYAERYSYDRQGERNEESEEGKEGVGPEPDTVTRVRRRSRASGGASPKRARLNQAPAHAADEDVFTVDELIRIRVTGRGEKQVLVQWEGYRRPTWEPFDSMQQQLPEMVATLESRQRDDEGNSEVESSDDETERPMFLEAFIIEHRISKGYRWTPDRLNTLEHAAASCVPPVRETADQLRQTIMTIVCSDTQGLAPIGSKVASAVVSI